MNLQEIAWKAGATDLFALRKLSDLCYFNVGGVGRGEGWAGNLTLDPAAEPMLDKAAASGFEFTRGSHPRQIFGPYWTSAAALVSDGGSIVVVGGDDLTTEQKLLTELAGQAMANVGDVSPTKLEADEAEIDQARQSVAAIPGRGDRACRGELARRAAMALGCEFGAVLSSDNQISTADLGWWPAADDSELVAALFPLCRASAESFHVEQDAAACRHAVRPLGCEGWGRLVRGSPDWGRWPARNTGRGPHRKSSPRFHRPLPEGACNDRRGGGSRLRLAVEEHYW